MMRDLKRDLCSPSEDSRSGAPFRIILCRTFGSRCWGGGSGGEETHGMVGRVRSVRSQSHGAALCKKRDMLAPSANQRAALLKVHSSWKRRLYKPTNDGSAGVN